MRQPEEIYEEIKNFFDKNTKTSFYYSNDSDIFFSRSIANESFYYINIDCLEINIVRKFKKNADRYLFHFIRYLMIEFKITLDELILLRKNDWSLEFDGQSRTVAEFSLDKEIYKYNVKF